MKKLALWLIRGYQLLVSPFTPPRCRYFPTCSEYARQGIEKYGARRGVAYAIRRILRCHPFSRGGYDPLP